MSDPNGWPERPGVPMHPEEYRAHCLQFRDNRPVVALWLVIPRLWLLPDTHKRMPDEVASWRYLGPCLTPQEVAARVAEAEARGHEDGLQGGITAVKARVWPPSTDTRISGFNEGIAAAVRELERLHTAIRALKEKTT
jgi:hypothetical protein